MRALAAVEDARLEADGLVLRRPVPEDAPLVFRGARDPLVREFLQAVIPHQDLAAAERWLTEVPPLLWTEGRAAYFTVLLDGEPIGWAELVNLDAADASAE